MEIKYDDKTIEVDDLTCHLKTYAVGVLAKMQKFDPEYKDCWTACSITFNELQPEFCWGSIEDIGTEDGIYVELPITK